MFWVLQQIRGGIPATLRYIGLSDLLPLRNVIAVVDRGFPMVRVVRVGNSYWTVHRKADGTFQEMEAWSKRTVMYHTGEWLEWLGCEDGHTREPSEFPS